MLKVAQQVFGFFYYEFSKNHLLLQRYTFQIGVNFSFSAFTWSGSARRILHIATTLRWFFSFKVGQFNFAKHLY